MSILNEILKKGFLLGLGAAIASKEKLEQKLDELVKENELTTAQAKELMQNFIEKGEGKKEEWSKSKSDQAQKYAEELGLATKQDIKNLQDRIADLELKLEDK